MEIFEWAVDQGCRFDLDFRDDIAGMLNEQKLSPCSI